MTDESRLRQLKKKFEELATKLAIKESELSRATKTIKKEYGLATLKEVKARKPLIEEKLAGLEKRKIELFDKVEIELGKVAEISG